MAVADNLETGATSTDPANDICYRCKETGHRAKDCPTKKSKQQQSLTPPSVNTPTPAPPQASLSTNSASSATDDSKICYRCKQSGHFASACPDKKRAREAADSTVIQVQPARFDTAAAAAPAAAASSTEQCYRCQQIGHRASACPTKKKQKTDETITASATVDSSSSSSSTTVNRRCYICKSADHLSSACPNKDKQHTTTSRPPPTYAATRRPPAAAKPCYRCQATTHSTIDCPVPKHCHYCQSATHLAADCPDKRTILRQREKEKEKACNRCGEHGHIERECPTLPHRQVWRQEGKERATGCYVCGSVDHYAVECGEVTGLEVRMKEAERRWSNGDVVGENECERFLVGCAAALEYRGAVWLLQQMADKGVAVTAGGWEALERLHSVSGKDQSRVELAAIERVKKPKQQLGTHIKQHRATERLASVRSHLTSVVAAIERLVAGGGGAVVAASAFALCTKLREVVGEAELSAKESREAVMALVKEGRLKKGSKGLVWQPDGGEKDKKKQKGGVGDEKAGKAGSTAEEHEKEKKRKLKRAQEKKRKAAKKLKMTASPQQISTAAESSTNVATLE